MREVGKSTVIDWIVSRLRGLVQDVPDHIEVCEFHCSQPNCLQGNFDSCPLRKARTSYLN